MTGEVMTALAGGSVKDADLADALACDLLHISYAELQEMPERVLSYRLAIAREKARIQKAQMPLGD